VFEDIAIACYLLVSNQPAVEMPYKINGFGVNI